MRRLALLVACLAASGAEAQPPREPLPFRWTLGFAQGTLEAMVRAGEASYIAFVCPAGEEEVFPSILVQAAGRIPPGRQTLQLVVDDRNFAFALRDGVVEGRGRAAAAEIRAAAQALSASRRPNFLAEIPEMRWRQSFSLLNVRDALGRPGRTIVHGCES